MRVPEIVERRSGEDDFAIALYGPKPCPLDGTSEHTATDVPLIVRRPSTRQEHEILIT